MSKSNTHDSHKMGLVMATAMVTGNMMGSGLFLLPSTLAVIGSISVISWLITTLGALALALVFAKLGLIRPQAGGPYVYAKAAFGDYLGFQTAWIHWLGNWVGNIAIAIAAVGYLSYFFPVLNQPIYSIFAVLGILWFFTCINFFGARFWGRIQVITTLCMLLPVVGTVLFGWFWFDPELWVSSLNVTHTSNMSAIIQGASITLWAFIGVESASISAGIVKHPHRTVPLATMIGIGIAGLAYILGSSVIMGILDHDTLRLSAAPYSLVAELALGPIAGDIVSLCAVLACCGTLGGWILAVGQIAKAGAEDAFFPSVFAKTNDKNVPVLGLVIIACLMSVMLIITHSDYLSQHFEKIIIMAVVLTLLPYLYSASALMIIGIQQPHLFSRKELSLYVVVFLIATTYCLGAILGTDAHIVLFGLIVVLLSIPGYISVLRRRKALVDESVLL